jgi:peptide/nickel transport system permease protein
MTNNTEAAVPVQRVEKKRLGFFADLFKRMVREKPLGTFGLGVVVILLIAGIFASLIAPYGMKQIDLLNRLQGPSSMHYLGTDQLGRDELSQLIFGAQISLVIGLSATAISTVISILIGAVSGYIGGKLDLFVQRFVDVWMSIPSMAILLTIVNILPRNELTIIMVIGITGGIGGSRGIRSAVFWMKGNVYVAAADAIGSPRWRTMLRHILPNVMAMIIIGFTIGVGGAILQESSLSFLGMGLQPGIPSWGAMINGGGQQYLQTVPELALWPGFALSITIYGINMFGDGLRDLLDPRLRGGIGRYALSDKKLKELKEQLVKEGS